MSMLDELSFTSSSHSHTEEDSEESRSDTSSIFSGLSELSATTLAVDYQYAIVWELLQGCQEAALVDIPERHRPCLSIFDVQGSLLKDEIFFSEQAGEYDDIFQIAGAVKCSKPWSLPVISRHISKEDALQRQNIQVLNVTEVTPTAAVYISPDTGLADVFQQILDAAQAASASEEVKSILENTSPLVQVEGPAFASTVFTSASWIAHESEEPSIHTLRRYNRLASTSLLRQARSFHIDRPIFGILLRGSHAVIHIDWYEERDGIMEYNSAFYTRHDTTDFQIWDLKKPNEKSEFKIILSNLRKYTAGSYATRVQHCLQAIKKPPHAWKWRPSPSLELQYNLLPVHAEESPQEKMSRWRESVWGSENNKNYSARLQRQLRNSRTGGGVNRRIGPRGFLSPPSTPQ